MAIYTTQSSLRIQLNTEVDLTGISSAAIKYRKPDNTESQFTATVLDAAAGIIYYDLVSAELDQVGKWYFWAYITFGDARVAPGNVASAIVSEEG